MRGRQTGDPMDIAAMMGRGDPGTFGGRGGMDGPMDIAGMMDYWRKIAVEVSPEKMLSATGALPAYG